MKTTHTPMNDHASGDNENELVSLIDFVRDAAGPVVSRTSDLYAQITWPTGDTIDIDHRHLAPGPDRPIGTTSVHKLSDILPLVTQRQTETETVVTYADHKARTITTVLNDESQSTSGWADHRIEYRCDRSPAWQAWLNLDRALHEQTDFATHIEDRLGDIIQPDPADLLEIAQTMAASGSVEMRSARRLRDGRTQLNFHEETNAVGGADGQLEIPSAIGLRLPLFHGVNPTEVSARFRFRFRSGALTVGYLLNDPEAIERDAFATLTSELASAVPWLVVEAAAPPNAH